MVIPLHHPLSACSLCAGLHDVLFFQRGWVVSVVIETAEDLNCPAELSSWNRLFRGNLPSQESSLLQLERRIAEGTQRESDRSKSDLSQPFCLSLLSSEPSEDTNRFLSAYSPNSVLSHILASMQSLYSFARNQSRG